jgi:hypothetical protein
VDLLEGKLLPISGSLYITLCANQRRPGVDLRKIFTPAGQLLVFFDFINEILLEIGTAKATESSADCIGDSMACLCGNSHTKYSNKNRLWIADSIEDQSFLGSPLCGLPRKD